MIHTKTRAFPRALPLWALVLCALSPLHAVDFGLLLNQTVTLDDAFSGDLNSVSYSGSFIPWFSGKLVENGDLYISAGVTPMYENTEFFILPELLRTEVTLRPERNTELKFGRTAYTDPLGLIASGLFDGFQVSRDAGEGVLRAGAWYTGLQYKKSANITVSPEDQANYFAALDTADIDTYFSSQRILAAAGWEHPALAGALNLRLAVLGQFDLNGEEAAYHSEYFAGRLSLPVRNVLVFDLGGALELIQIKRDFPDGEDRVALLGEVGAAWLLPSPVQDRLSFTALFSSGETDDSPLGAFLPLTTVSQGEVLKAKLSGLAHFNVDYTARLHDMFSASAGASYFLRTSPNTVVEWPAPSAGNEDKAALGAEFYSGLFFSLTSDLGLNLGGGVFVPQLGNMAPKERPRWKFDISFRAALF
jgi:hypothetical protein